MEIENTIQQLEDRLRGNPKSLLFARLADLYLRKGRIDEAIDLCIEGVKNNPSYVTGNFILGKAYIAKGDHEKAEAEFKKVLSHDQQYLAAHKHLGDMMAKMGWENSAAMHYKDILRIDPLDEEARQMLETFSLEENIQTGVFRTEGKMENEQAPAPEKIADLKKEEENWMGQLEEVFSEKKHDFISEPSLPSIEEETKESTEIEEKDVEELKEEVTETVEEGKKEEEFAFDLSEEKELEFTAEENSFPDTEAEEKEEFSFGLEEKEEEKKEEEETVPPAVEVEEKEEKSIFDLPEEKENEVTTEEISSLIAETEKEEEFSFGLEEMEEEKEEEEETVPPAIETEEKAEEKPLPPLSEEEPKKDEDYETLSLSEEEVVPEEKETDTLLIHTEEPSEEKIELDSSAETVEEKKIAESETKIPSVPSEKPDSEAKKITKKQKLVSPTLGEIYAAQGQYAKAIRVYETLLEKNPDDEGYQQKIEELKQKLKNSSKK